MTTYLDAIIERKRSDLQALKDETPLAEVRAKAEAAPPALDFAEALRAPGVQVIAEVKKASPSKGEMAPDLDPGAIARTYAAHGAAAISVLTEEPHFRGRIDFLDAIKEGLDGAGPPLLRKDFILEPYQDFESRAHRADALLLIVAVLSDGELQELLGLSRHLSMEALVEVHDAAEAARAVAAGAEVIGINNRDLRTFHTSLETTGQVRPSIPPGKVVVSESGISTRAEVLKVAGWGVDACLVGEALVTAKDPGAKLEEFLAR